MLIKIGGHPDHSFDEPLGLLSDCHRRIEHFLHVLELVAARNAHPMTSAERIDLQTSRTYFATAAPRHTADEEQSLFPRLRASADPDARRPLDVLPLLYFAAAHIAIGTAFAAVAVDPRGVAGFFYHARMLAIVHLVTLGWITSSILGALYVVGPIALRVHLPATARDYTAFALVAIGIAGMVAHFWIQAYSGIAWSACSVFAGIVIVAARAVPPVVRAPLPPAVRAHIVFAFVNISAAALLGILTGFDKVSTFCSGSSSRTCSRTRTSPPSDGRR